MNSLSRLIIFLIMTLSFTAPAGAAVSTVDIAGACDVVAADDEKKPEGDKKPDGEKEPDCE